MKMNRDPKTQDHPLIVYLLTIMVLCMVLFVLAGVVNHLAFSSDGPGLLVPLMKKFEKKQSPAFLAAQAHWRAEEHRRFHHLVDYPQTPAAYESTCVICHTNLAHTKTKKVRALLNMHSNYLECETCHMEIRQGQSVVYQWYSPMEKHPKGPFFGTSYNPNTGELEMVDDHFSKITPFQEISGEMAPLVYMQDRVEAKDFLKQKDQLNPEQQKDAAKKFHENLRPKGLECKACHAAEGILDFKQLGFSPKRIVDIENLNITGMITKYNLFYLPDLLEKPADTESEDRGGQ